MQQPHIGDLVHAAVVLPFRDAGKSHRGHMRILVLALLATQIGCGAKHYLREYRFSDRTLGVVFIESPQAELRHGWYDVDVGGNAIQNVVQAGGKVAREVEARRALSRSIQRTAARIARSGTSG